MNAAMNVGVSLSVAAVHRVKNLVGVLSRSAVVEIDQVSLAMDLLIQNRKVFSNFGGRKCGLVHLGLSFIQSVKRAKNGSSAYQSAIRGKRSTGIGETPTAALTSWLAYSALAPSQKTLAMG